MLRWHGSSRKTGGTYGGGGDEEEAVKILLVKNNHLDRELVSGCVILVLNNRNPGSSLQDSIIFKIF